MDTVQKFCPPCPLMDENEVNSNSKWGTKQNSVLSPFVPLYKKCNSGCPSYLANELTCGVYGKYVSDMEGCPAQK